MIKIGVELPKLSQK